MPPVTLSTHLHTAGTRQLAPWVRGGFLAAAGTHLAVLVWALYGGSTATVLPGLVLTSSALAAISWPLARVLPVHFAAAVRLLGLVILGGLLVRLALAPVASVDAVLLAVPALQCGLVLPALLGQRALPWLAGTSLVAGLLLTAVVVPMAAVQLGALVVALGLALVLVIGLVHAVTEPLLHGDA